MLTLTFLGVGSAFAKRNFQSNALVEAWKHGPERQDRPDETLLIDFGMTGPLALHHLKDQHGFAYLAHNRRINYVAIDRIFITHLHADHVGGLFELAGVCRYAYKELPGGRALKPRLLAADDVLCDLWERCLVGSLGPRRGGCAALSDYFVTETLRASPAGRAGQHTMLDRYTFTLFRTDHIRIHEKYDWPAYGLLLADDRTDETVFFSSDSRLDVEGNGALMRGAKLLFHDTQLEPAEDPIHASIGELRELPGDLRKRMALYHYSDRYDDPEYAFIADEFAGLAQPRLRYPLFES